MTYRGTAEAYDRYRPPYPPAMLDDVRRFTGLGSDSRVLDLACGTGQVAFALADDVGEIVAVDREPEFVELARTKAARTPARHITVVNADVETVALDGVFDLVTFGNAFHRLDRTVALRRVVPHLRFGGYVALLWGDTPWVGDEPWQRAMADVLDRWRTDVGGPSDPPATPHVDVLAGAGLDIVDRTEYATTERWTVESLCGFVASTSFLNHHVLGDRVTEFRRDLTDSLRVAEPGERFDHQLSWALDLARR